VASSPRDSGTVVVPIQEETGAGKGGGAWRLPGQSREGIRKREQGGPVRFTLKRRRRGLDGAAPRGGRRGGV
jgi:hypothetical protein